MGKAMLDNAINTIAHNPLPCRAKGGSSELTGIDSRDRSKLCSPTLVKMLLFLGSGIDTAPARHVGSSKIG